MVIQAKGFNVLIKKVVPENDSGFVVVDDNEVYSRGTVQSVGQDATWFCQAGDEVIYLKSRAHPIGLGFDGDLIIIDMKYIVGTITEEKDAT